VLLEYVRLADAVILNREVLELARKFGDRSWVLQGIGGGRDLALRTGDWDDYLDDVAAEAEAAGDYHDSWFRMEQAWRQAYRGEADAAHAVIEENLASGRIANSGQAITWHLAALADTEIAQGRFADAIETAARGFATAAENDLVILSTVFAAAALGDASRVRTAIKALGEHGFDQLPAGRGFIAVADSLAAAVEERWDEARDLQREAEALLTEVGHALVNARFGLALGHLAVGRFPEADRAAAEAERWFSDRGAAEYVAAYRANALRSGSGAGGGAAARRQPAVSVRAGG
jgi:hypothetical protein